MPPQQALIGRPVSGSGRRYLGRKAGLHRSRISRGTDRNRHSTSRTSDNKGQGQPGAARSRWWRDGKACSGCSRGFLPTRAKCNPTTRPQRLRSGLILSRSFSKPSQTSSYGLGGLLSSGTDAIAPAFSQWRAGVRRLRRSRQWPRIAAAPNAQRNLGPHE